MTRQPPFLFALMIVLALWFGPATVAVAEPVPSEVERSLQEVVKRSANAERRAGQARDLAWANLGASLLLPLLLLLLLSVRNWNLGQFLYDREIHRIRRRQALLKQGLAALTAELAGTAESRQRLSALVSVLDDQLGDLDRGIAAKTSPGEPR